jgi:hypothetical protein
VIIRSDNTATCYNINRRAAGITLLPPLLHLLRFADRVGIELTAEHVRGVDNTIADRLSRISPGGDYALKMEVLEAHLREWGLQIDADLFAAGWNAKHRTYCSLKPDSKAFARDAFLINWSQFRLPLLHPPIPLIPKVLQRLESEKMTAVLVLPNWSTQPWSLVLRRMTVRSKDLGPTDAVLVRGSRMTKVRAELPPGNLAILLLDTKTMPEKSSSSASYAPTESATTTSTTSPIPENLPHGGTTGVV